jgi:protein-disulfide isomerase
MPRDQNDMAAMIPPGSSDHILGPPSATVVVIEYADFQCASCRAVYPAVKILLNEFRDQVRFMFRHYPVVEAHPLAERAAEAAEAAAMQGRFWLMHDLLFDNQHHLQDVYLRQYASRANLDLCRYDQDMARRAYLPLVHEHKRGGLEAGARGTPTFFVNGVLQDVTFGMENLYKAIEANLQSMSVS